MRLIPIAIGTFAFSAISGRLVARLGVLLPLACGGTLILGAGVLLLCAGVDRPEAVLGAAFCFGAGLGLVNAPITTTAVTGMGEAAGAASGVVSTSRQLGMSIGIAFAAAITDPSTGRTAPSWIALTGCGAVILICAAIFATPDGMPPAIASGAADGAH
ncbi:MAG TPA: MFS transporter [Gemmatimonadales bacterium]|nr:MFS transporter [Gemmatimonadales bacterium]